MPALRLRDEDARIAYLATVYHLGRPGSETDPDTLQRHDLGLRSVHDRMLEQLGQAEVEVDVSAYQLMRLGEALLGVSNELKQFGMANGRSAVPGFEDAMGEVYPASRQDPGLAMDVVQHAVMLHRRLGAALEQARQAVEEAREEQRRQQEADSKPWWQVWRRD